MCNILFSIIVPCYNEQDNIRKLVTVLDRVRKDRNIEYILVENGSTDNSRKLLEQVCRQRKLFKIVYVDKNRGYGYGLKQGLKAAEGDYIGWIHADMQIRPKDVVRFVDYVIQNQEIYADRIFVKGRRQNRSVMEHFFTGGMTVYASIMLRTVLYDIGAVPVLFHRSLLAHLDRMPYDFSVETYVYWQAKRNGYAIKRFPVMVKKREAGKSSWANGLSARIALSKRIMKAILEFSKHRT